MPNMLLSYDVEKKPNEDIHKKVKDELKSTYGYSDTVVGDGSKTHYLLPNTTLVKINTSREVCATEFKAACAKHNAKWERFIIVDYNGSTFNNQK